MKRIYNQGRIINQDLYEQLKELDRTVVFPFCYNEFQANRDWWVELDSKGKIAAYCGCLYSEGVCIFVRAWVRKDHRGHGLQRKMIERRIKAAKENDCNVAITYTTCDNVHSINNLIRSKFLLYIPEYAYSGRGCLYWKREL